MTIDLRLGDCVQWARDYSGEPFHALLCDPPYEMKFMGKDWDNSGIVFDPATWEAFKRIMYPGAFGMAFASSRGWHRLACAIEDAGFVIHPSLFGWTYGSGFPKATRLNHGHPKTETFSGHRYGLQALKPALEPVIVFQRPYEGRPVDNITATGAGVLSIDAARIKPSSQENGEVAYMPPALLSLLGVDDMRGISPESYRGLLLRISSALRSYSIDGKDHSHSAGVLDGNLPAPALCEFLLTHLYPNGAWCGLNLLEAANSLNGCQSCHRLYDVQLRRVQEAAQENAPSLADALERICQTQPSPSHNPCSDNVRLYSALFTLLVENIIAHSATPRKGKGNQGGRVIDFGGDWYRSEEYETQGRWPANFYVDEEAARRLDEQSGSVRSSGHINESEGYSADKVYNFGAKKRMAIPGVNTYSDSGGASRFFFNVREQIDDADPVRYVAKASRAERDAGLEGFDEKESTKQFMVGMEGAIHSDGHARSNKPIMARNPHPTVKPLALTRYLATLLLPPAEYAPRRLFVPFAGVASECIGAMQAGWEQVTGVELTAEYIPIAEARVKHWETRQLESPS
jgi:hypothetical protein